MSPPRTSSPSKLGFLIPRGIEAEAQQLWRGMSHAEEPHYTPWLLRIVLDHCTNLEVTHHGGKPWPPATADQMRRAGFGRGRPSGSDRRTVTVRPTAAEAGRIRGTAVGMEIPLADLVTEAVRAHIAEAPRTSTGPGEPPGP